MILKVNFVTLEPVSEEKILAAIESGPYGRCVFYCDNNVVDHQTTQMLFENGITATLHMTGFSLHGGGDFKLVEALYNMLEGNAGLETSLEASVESHLMGIKAEESRLAEGQLLLVHN